MADLSQTAADVSLTDVTGNGVSAVVAGEAITQGQPVYLLSSKYYKADADTQQAANCQGIALTPAAADELFVLAADRSTLDVGATLTIGETYVVSSNAGAIAPISDLTTGNFVTILGTAITAGKLPLNIIPGTVAKP